MDEQSQEHPAGGGLPPAHRSSALDVSFTRGGRDGRAICTPARLGLTLLSLPGESGHLRETRMDHGHSQWFQEAPRQRVGIKGKIRGDCCGYEINVH